MYNYFGTAAVPEDVVERLTLLEQQIDAPVRIVPWGRNVRDNRWGSAERGDYSANVAHESGITICMGTREEGNYYYLYPEPGNQGAGLHYSCYSPTEPYDIVLEHDFDGANQWAIEQGYSVGTQFGELQEEPRIAYSWIQLTSYYSRDWLEHTAVLWDILVQAVEDHFGGAPMTDEERAAWRADRELQAFNRYVERVFNGQLQARRAAIDTHTSAIADAQSTIARETAALIQDQTLLDALLIVQQNDSAATMRSEYELLANHPRLAERQLRGQKLVLTTTDDLRLTRDDTGESRWLGAFRITIDLQDFSIRMENLNTRRGGRHHPHIPGDGSPCFGNHATGFYELLGQGQLYVCFDLLLQYIETVNLRDEWGRYASYWFEVEDERPEGWQPVDQEPADEIETEQDAEAVLA